MPAPYEQHRAQLKVILLAWGMPEDNAEATADILSGADLLERAREYEGTAAHHQGDAGLRTG
jgi:hypothetical protein